jgi:hypothetical protein
MVVCMTPSIPPMLSPVNDKNEEKQVLAGRFIVIWPSKEQGQFLPASKMGNIKLVRNLG